ncbi:MAG: CRISPR-associated endonuclease Cas2 [Endomicrobiia bacterium]
MFYVVCYDISNDKRRNIVAKVLENYAVRVQESVFEIICDEEIIKEILNKLEPIVDKKEDSLRVYTICSSCLKKITVIGVGEVTKDIEVFVV